jgi:hypothetical protein
MTEATSDEIAKVLVPDGGVGYPKPPGSGVPPYCGGGGGYAPPPGGAG